MKSIDLVIKYYKTSGVDIPQPIQELIDEITRLSPCEHKGYRQKIERLKKEKEWLIKELAWEKYFSERCHKKRAVKKIKDEMQQALKDKP